MTLTIYLFPKLRTGKDVVIQMSKKPLRFRTTFDSQHAKGLQTLVKSAQQHFYHIFHNSGANRVGICLC